ncbi:FAD-binding oxidoreductase [Qipengyuania sp. GH1]|uniref:NAD(P)/FAD-dependent oxidoreductase n=1 Tax=Qipengyuania aestuarii TaxID=2867241 RepID=UPI001C879D04|nr:FAD-binding oxidoreductase [Qipengyuania aestuarii]
MKTYDFAIIGAGIAGASLAAELGQHGAHVLLLEAEDQPGYHATGRSAAFWDECYGGPEIVPLTLASGAYLRDHGFLTKRGALYIGRQSDEERLASFMDRFSDTGAGIERVGASMLHAHVAGLRTDWTGGIWEPACADIDVAGLHAHFLALCRAEKVDLECRAALKTADRIKNSWRLDCGKAGIFAASVLVNAAGAWADDVAVRVGASAIGIQPLLRTVVQLRTDPAPAPDQPLVLDISGNFYFKPEAGRLWLSPHDEKPSEPCDAAPEELAVATAIHRLEQVVNWKVEAVEKRWAGLRSFAPDRLPIYGFDPRVEGFAWFAGQGGFGIQTSPAAARLVAQLLLGEPRDEMTRCLDASLYDPSRFY